MSVTQEEISLQLGTPVSPSTSNIHWYPCPPHLSATETHQAVEEDAYTEPEVQEAQHHAR